ncbi:MAG: DNA adenine methylase, partial [Roseomonas sp.]|nr:DNA adenine methylase [Roseomonas sp.]
MNTMMRKKALDANPTMQLGLLDGGLPLSESDEFLTQQLITYIGNKRRLLPWISKALLSCLDLLNVKDISFADVFAGTGAVSRLARQCSHSLFINDFEKYSALINTVYHSNYRQIDLKKIDKHRRKINEIASNCPREGFITKLYAPADET